MTTEQENRLNMFITSRDYQASYTTITNALPNYSVNSVIFVNTILQIQAVSELQKMSKKGITEGKNRLKEALIVLAADSARKLVVYAKFSNNDTLAREVNLSEGKLRKVADTAVKDYAQIVYDRIQPIVSALATYGITTTTQAALLNAINVYNAMIGKPGVGRVEISQATKQLEVLFKTAEDALTIMDTAIEIVKLTQPNFYNGYKSARKIIHSGSGSLAVKGLVTDAITGKPMKSVTVSFSLNGGTAKVINTSDKAADVVKKTAEKGGFNIKSLAMGVYQVTLKKMGYADQVVTVSVNAGEMSVVDVKMEKI